MTDTWNPERYEKFSNRRERPFADLTSRVGTAAPKVVVDLSCGPGPIDVIATNALLQWVPSHLKLIPRWVSALATGGLVRHAGAGQLHGALAHAAA